MVRNSSITYYIMTNSKQLTFVLIMALLTLINSCTSDILTLYSVIYQVLAKANIISFLHILKSICLPTILCLSRFQVDRLSQNISLLIKKSKLCRYAKLLLLWATIIIWLIDKIWINLLKNSFPTSLLKSFGKIFPPLFKPWSE